MGDLSTVKAIYTDGACSGNPGPGGWGVAVYWNNGQVHELGGAESATTNNRMELQAAIAALEFAAQLEQPDPIPVYTDSEYVKNGITKWIHGWKKKGWKTAAGKPVLNQDLWQALDRLNSNRVTWRYVRGHAGNEGNERCDAIARAFSQGQVPNLKQSFRPNPAPTEASATAVPDPAAEFRPPATNRTAAETIRCNDHPSGSTAVQSTMTDIPPTHTSDLEDVPREIRVAHLRHLIDTLQMADEIAAKAYLITSSELADLMDVNASAVTSRGDNWVWRNWVVSRVRREGNQILWQLERVD
jgi:ribonuclease HI